MDINKICIIGGGSITHTLIPLLSRAGKRVSLLTRNPALWNKTIAFNYETENGEVITSCEGNIDAISDKPEDVIPDAQMVLLCMPVASYRDALNRIGPFIDPNRSVLLGTIYGQGGFNWMVDAWKKEYKLSGVEYFAFGMVPWICRTKAYGKQGVTYGPKDENVIAISDKSLFQPLLKAVLNDLSLRFFDTGRFHLADNFLSLTLSVDNQIIHTSRLYALCRKYDNGRWESLSQVPYFYKDYDDASVLELEMLDRDYEAIRNEIKKRFAEKSFKFMLNYLDYEHFNYAFKSPSIKDSFVNSPRLGAIRTPVVEKEGGFEIDKTHRFFSDDIYYGLCIAKWMAQELRLDTPKIDEILNWVQHYLDEPIIENKRLMVFEPDPWAPFKYGVPSVYGLNTLDGLVD